MSDFSYTFLIPLIPLTIFLVTGLFGMKWKPIVSGMIGTIGLAIAWVLALYTGYEYFFSHSVQQYQTIIPLNMLWLSFTPSLQIHMGILIDPISVLLIVVVTTISFMAHWFSLGYMKGEKGFARYYAFLSLFTFSMLGLVLSTNIFQMYIFWELVGASSFLLIGFYYTKPSAVAAAKKAFIVTRFADFGFLVGILILSFFTKTFDFSTLTAPVAQGTSIFSSFAGASFMGASALSWAMALIFIGGAGKSAMFPFHIWLPDAMEGPTPVSSLIHAATMVVAGVYLVARLFPIYHFQTPDVLIGIGYVGGFTSLFAAIIAMTQFDIKRVLAYSTLSQIGYMMVGLGVSGYGGHHGLGYMAGMFHLFTHAMFKALLFLGAGSIIHAVHSNYMKDMGGLRKYMPITHITFLAACLAISGVPPFAGFFSKDQILEAALESNKLLYWTEYITAGLTSFYIFRLYFRIFWGKNTDYGHHTPHESPLTMTIPLIFLALGSTFGGLIPFHNLISPDLKPMADHLDWVSTIPSILIGLVGIAAAWFLYQKETSRPKAVVDFLGNLHTWAYHKFYIDEIYLFVAKKIMFGIIATSVAWFDRHIVDGFMFGVADVTMATSGKIKKFQSGNLQEYAFVFVAGSLALVLILLYIF
jgi:NADH-quinone oxidoreductase subunit L